MKKIISTLLVACTLVAVPATVVSAADTSSENWVDITFSIDIPSDYEFPKDGSVFIMYTGAATDLFAELNGENEFTRTIQAPVGEYGLYQVTTSFDTSDTYMARSTFVAGTNTPEIKVYIMEEDGYINLDDDAETANLASYGNFIASQVEQEQSKEQELLAKEQAESATNSELPSSEVTVDAEGRASKVKNITGTEDIRESEKIKVAIICSVLLMFISVGVLVILMKKRREIRAWENNNDTSARN